MRSTVRTSHAQRACGDSAPTVPSSRLVSSPSPSCISFPVALGRAMALHDQVFGGCRSARRSWITSLASTPTC